MRSFFPSPEPKALIFSGFEKGPERTQLGENGQLMKYPVAVLVGTCLLIFLSYSPLCQEKRKTNKFLDIMAKFGNLFPYLLAIFAPFPPLSGPLWGGMTVSVAVRYKEGKKAMKSLMGGMASFRLATFISVIIVPVVSFMNPVFPVGSGITLLFQAYVCARIGMEYCKSATDKSIAAIMAAVLAFKRSAWALIVGGA